MRKRKSSGRNWDFYLDYKLFVLILFLMGVGIFAILDVSIPKAIETFSDKFYFVKQQSLWMVVGLFVFLFAISVIFLIVVLIPQAGLKVLGARRWLDLGLLSFQPSEFAKIALCVYLAKVSEVKKNVFSFILPIAVTVGLVMLQPDLGTSVVLIIIAFAQIFMSEINLMKVFIVFFGGVILISLLIFSSQYRRERVTAFLNPFSKSDDTSYHIKQVLYSLAWGGVGGTGIGQSTQKYLFVPEVTTDSIFAIISEETGFLGSAILIILYALVSLRMIKLISGIDGDFQKSLGVGIFAWFTGQVFVNLSSISSLIPFTGVPLPFISYGGSTLVSILLAFGIFNSILKYSTSHD